MKMGSSLFCVFLASSLLLVTVVAGNFHQDFDLTWGANRSKIFNDGDLLSLSLDRDSGSGFRSKKEYLFGKIDMQLKLVAGDSAGTVTSYYLSSEGARHDEIDFEFLGNVSGQPYILHTNVYAQGIGNREQQFYLWFDPTKNFHTYSINWSSRQIIFLVDNTPIRVFKNVENLGVPYPRNQPMKIYSSLWDADNWATRGGLVKTDWSKAPFVAFYRNFRTVPNHSSSSSTAADEELDSYAKKRLLWVRRHFMVYDYCTDKRRFPHRAPTECRKRARPL